MTLEINRRVPKSEQQSLLLKQVQAYHFGRLYLQIKFEDKSTTYIRLRDITMIKELP